MSLKLQAEVGLDGSGFERGLHRLGERGKEFSTDFVKNAAISAFGLYGIEEAIHKTVETATELVNESKRLDVTVEQLQLLRQAAKDGGTEMGTLASAFEKLDIARAEALKGDKDALAAFATLGVSKEQLEKQNAAGIVMGPISNAAKSNNVANLAPAFEKVLGRGFGEILPVLKTDFDELGGKMQTLGTIMDTDMAVKLKAMGDNFELLGNIMTVHLGPVLITLAEWLLKAVGGLKELSAFLGGLTSHGVMKGALTLGKSMNEDAIGMLPDILKNPLTKLNDKLYEKMGLPAKEADDIFTAAGDAANEVGDAWKRLMDGLKAKLEAEADDLKNPKPIVPPTALGDATAHGGRRGVTPSSDALVRVGNFLGSNGNTISRVDQKKIHLMEQHLIELKKITKSTGGGGTFGYGLGVPDFL